MRIIVARFLTIFDPTLRMIALAIALSAFLPASGVWETALRIFSNIGIFVLFLLNGVRIRRSEIFAGLRNYRFLVPLFLWVFVAMAGAGWGAASTLTTMIPPLVAAGFIYLGVLPTTIQSATSYTILSKGNPALSVVGSALVNVAGIFLSAPLFAMLGGGEYAFISSATVFKIIGLLLFPFVLGQIVQDRFHGHVKTRGTRLIWLDRVVISLSVFLAFSGAMKQDFLHNLSVTSLGLVFAAVSVLLVISHVGCWIITRIMRYAAADARAFLFTAAQKSVAIGAPLGALLFPPDKAGFLLLPLLLYHLMQLVLAAILSSHFRHAG